MTTRAFLPAVPATLAAALLLGACAAVPDVESRLSQLRFYPNMYVVQAGDTLETIAFRYRLEPAELAALNPGAERALPPGTRLNVRPGTELAPEVRAAARVAWAPATMARGPAAAAAASAGTPVRPPSPAPAVRPAPVATTAPAPDSPAPVVLAQRDAPAYAAPAQPVQPVREPDVIVNSAAFDPITGGAPNEQVVADDLDGYVPSSAADAGAARTSAGASAANGWTWPTEGAVARGYAPGTVGGQGIDIAGVPGQDVRAAAGGTVVYSGRDLSGGGNLVILRHGDDLMTTYSHADKLFVTEDDTVRAGDPIASLGWNADAESVLRFEVRRDGAPLDPLSFIGR